MNEVYGSKELYRKTIFISVFFFVQVLFITFCITFMAILIRSHFDNHVGALSKTILYTRKFGIFLFLLPILWLGFNIYIYMFKKSMEDIDSEILSFWLGLILTIVTVFISIGLVLEALSDFCHG